MKLLGLMLEIIGEGIESVIKYIGARFFFLESIISREEKIKKRKMQKYRSSLFVESRSNGNGARLANSVVASSNEMKLSNLVNK